MTIRSLKQHVFLSALTVILFCGSSIASDLEKKRQQEWAKENRIRVTNSNISAVEFSSLDDQDQKVISSRFIKKIWKTNCRPTEVRRLERAYDPKGASSWMISCAGFKTNDNYMVRIPVSASDPARILECWHVDSFTHRCSIEGQPRLRRR